MALGPAWLSPDTLLTDLGGVALWVAALIIFAECGLLLGFFLPGDSLLFTIGLFIGRGDIDFPLWLACVVMAAAAFLGNVVGYEIGRAAGPAIFKKENSRLFKREYVDSTMAFFDRYGPVAIVLARFTPLVRTFITVTAGVGKMDRRKYLTYSAVGAVLWAAGITLLGRALGKVPLFRDHLEAGLLLLVVVSVIPMGIEAYRHRGKPGEAAPETSTEQSYEDAREPEYQSAEYDSEPQWAAAPPVYREPGEGSDETIPSGIPVNGRDEDYPFPDQGYQGPRRRH
jgi:membrane-associated protein